MAEDKGECKKSIQRVLNRIWTMDLRQLAHVNHYRQHRRVELYSISRYSAENSWMLCGTHVLRLNCFVLKISTACRFQNLRIIIAESPKGSVLLNNLRADITSKWKIKSYRGTDLAGCVCKAREACMNHLRMLPGRSDKQNSQHECGIQKLVSTRNIWH